MILIGDIEFIDGKAIVHKVLDITSFETTKVEVGNYDKLLELLDLEDSNYVDDETFAGEIRFTKNAITSAAHVLDLTPQQQVEFVAMALVCGWNNAIDHFM